MPYDSISTLAILFIQHKKENTLQANMVTETTQRRLLIPTSLHSLWSIHWNYWRLHQNITELVEQSRHVKEVSCIIS